MARAHRHYLPGCIWHITQRCHQREFLLKFHYYRQRWLYWMYEAKKRYDICILDYMVTSNHIHLLALSDARENNLARTMHLVSGRVAQEFNQRKERRGAFWEDRYHATAVEGSTHLMRCMLYIDTNMLRARAVSHPKEWPHCGYQELIGNKNRYTLVDKKRLFELLKISEDQFIKNYHNWISDYLKSKQFKRESCWTESVAVGGQEFVEKIKKQLGIRGKGRKVVQGSGRFELREPQNFYSGFYPYQK
ncbi:MAG: transposase [Candidatus Saccharicenans sp.]